MAGKNEFMMPGKEIASAGGPAQLVRTAPVLEPASPPPDLIPDRNARGSSSALAGSGRPAEQAAGIAGGQEQRGASVFASPVSEGHRAVSQRNEGGSEVNEGEEGRDGQRSGGRFRELLEQAMQQHGTVGIGLVYSTIEPRVPGGSVQRRISGAAIPTESRRVVPASGQDGSPPSRDLPVAKDGEEPMDRERALGILNAIAAVTEDDFVAQENQDHIGGHTLSEIQRAVAIRAEELIEEHRENPYSHYIAKETPQGRAVLEHTDESGDSVILHLYAKNTTKPAYFPRDVLVSFRLPLTTDSDNLMSYMDTTAKTNVLSLARTYEYSFDGTPVSEEDNLAFYKGTWFLAANLTDWGEDHTVMPRNPQKVDPRERERERWRFGFGAHPDPRFFGGDPDGEDGLALLERMLAERMGRPAREDIPAAPDRRFVYEERRREAGDRTPTQVIIDTSPRRDPDEQRMQQWTQENIASTQEAVAGGRHETVFYPASGRDHLRVLLAYNAGHLISIDSDGSLKGAAEDQVRRLGIEPRIQVMDGGTRRNITFTLDGRERTITEVIGDARSYSPQHFGLREVDVLHVQAPLSATDKYPEHPVPETYAMVAEGGFFVFGEGDFRPNAYPIPTSLAALIGLEEKTITRRHPYTISTMDPELDKYLADDKKKGKIYQKVRTVDVEAIKIFDEILIANSQMHYAFDMFERGDWKKLDVTEENGMNVQAGVQLRYEQLRVEVDAYAQRFAQAGIEQGLIDAYRAKTLQMFENKVLGMQQQMKDLLGVHDQAKQMAADHVDQRQILEFLGFTFDGGRMSMESTRGPLVRQLFISGQEKSTQTHGILTQFAEADFQTLFAEQTASEMIEIDRVAEVIVKGAVRGSEEVKAMTVNNIVSIQEAVQDGRHKTLYYPASGGDLLRPLVAYDVDQLIAVDIDADRFSGLETQLEEMGIHPNIEVSDNGAIRTLTFELNGRQRKITTVAGDARRFSTSDLDLPQVDIVHIYAPTGANIVMEGESGDLVEIDDKISLANYAMVAEGGFFSLGEGSLGKAFGVSPILLEIAGLEEKQISRRHPYTVLTSIYPTPDQIKHMDTTGRIYQKVRTVEPGVVEVFNQAIYNNFMMHLNIAEFERGNWWGLQVTEENNMDIQAGVAQSYRRQIEYQQELAQAFTDAGVAPELIERYKRDTLETFRAKVTGLQQQFSDLIAAYNDAGERHRAGQITDEQFLEEMSVFIVNDFGREKPVSKKWPIAPKLIYPENQDAFRATVKMMRAFIGTDMEAIFSELSA